MDLEGENCTSCNKSGKKIDKEFDQNAAPSISLSETTNESKSNTCDKMTCETVGVWNSLNVFQKSVSNVNENDKFPEVGSPDFTTLTESSISFKTFSPKPKILQLPNLKLNYRRTNRDFFTEDDDWDIYQPEFLIESIPAAESNLDTHLIWGKVSRKPEKYLSNKPSKTVNYNTLQQMSPSIPPITTDYQSTSSLNRGIAFKEDNEERMLKTVKRYFLDNPIRCKVNLSDLERKKCINDSPYFSKNFERKHFRSPHFLTTHQIQRLKDFTEERKKLEKEIANYEMYHRLFPLTDFFSKESTDIQSHRSPNQANSTVDGKSKDTSVSKTHTDNAYSPRTTMQATVIGPPGLNASNPNSFNTDKVNTISNLSRFSTKPLKRKILKSNDITETDLERRPFVLQSTNEEKEIQRSLNSAEGFLDKSYDSLGTVSMPPHIRYSIDQNKNSSEIQTYKLPNKIASANSFVLHLSEHSERDNKENLRNRQSEKSDYSVENVTNAASCIKTQSCQGDEKSRRKCLQENMNNFQME